MVRILRHTVDQREDCLASFFLKDMVTSLFLIRALIYDLVSTPSKAVAVTFDSLKFTFSPGEVSNRRTIRVGPTCSGRSRPRVCRSPEECGRTGSARRAHARCARANGHTNKNNDDTASIYAMAALEKEQTEKIIVLPGLAILAPPRVYALCLGTVGTALFTALRRLPAISKGSRPEQQRVVIITCRIKLFQRVPRRPIGTGSVCPFDVHCRTQLPFYTPTTYDPTPIEVDVGPRPGHDAGPNGARPSRTSTCSSWSSHQNLCSTTVQRTKLCRCEVRHESVAMAQNRNAAEKKERSGSVTPAQYIVRS
ncbi:hypothetical protein EVAR_67413_1 [Eumeta japonica]|uniref:Uncharacterized protein n=1 Tax=Eumeta variegata TaxID=151549 RepID=A0A4C2AAB5_EUMVA|nr:hypothetical protein EVAR_67413_1 [Eumeta japonica]